jgi:CTP-dependent riboflavin kinase
MRGEVIVGKLATGIGQGKHFTRLGWARQQFIDRLGIDPFPGTINVIVEMPAAKAAWQRLAATPGVRIDNPNDGPHDCDARGYLVSINGRVDGAIVLPEVAGYPPGQIEIIATVGVRAALGLKDGDEVKLEIR